MGTSHRSSRAKNGPTGRREKEISMRKRIFTLLAALCLLLCLLPTAAFASQTGGKTDESRSYNFDLSVGGAYEVRATTGETITVTLVLKRTVLVGASWDTPAVPMTFI